MTFLLWIKGLMLISARMAVLFLSVQPFGGIPIPAVARVILVVGLSVGLSAGLPMNEVTMLTTPTTLAAALFHELVIGGVFAAGLYAAFAAFHFAGRLLDVQIGFGLASLVDIATRVTTPLLSSLLTLLGTIYFFAIDGHLALLRLLRKSYEVFPVGGTLSDLVPGSLLAQFGTSFSLGFLLVAPVLFCLLLIDMGLAFASRTMPQMNVFVMSLAIKGGVGLLVLGLTLRLAGSMVDHIFNAMFQFLLSWMS